MSRLGAKRSSVIVISLLLGASLLLGGCASKTKLIQAGAAQFESESRAAIEKIDQLRQKEIEVPSISQQEASEQFVQLVTGSSGSITLKTLDFLIDPLKTEAPKSEAEWQAFLQKLRLQYTTFAATFASLEAGSLFAVDDVKDTLPILDKLIAQMAAFSHALRENPATFIRERAAIAIELEDVRDADTPADIKKIKLLDLERRLRDIAAAEKEMTRSTIEQTVKAAKLGTELRQLIMSYDELNVDGISEGLMTAFKIVGGIPGLNISGLQAETAKILEEINKDDQLKEFFDVALAGIPLSSGRTEGR